MIALAHNEKGEVLYRMVEFDKAIDAFGEALQHNAFLPSAFYNRGLIHYRMGNFSKIRLLCLLAYIVLPSQYVFHTVECVCTNKFVSTLGHCLVASYLSFVLKKYLQALA